VARVIAISRVAEPDLPELLPLLRAYCDFYEVSPSDEALLALARALIADPEHEGLQLLAREGGRAVGFATVYWSWDTLLAARIGVMHDLFVAPQARGRGIGRHLIEACRRECRARGAVKLAWQTARDNVRAQRAYDAVGATREEWLDYWVWAGTARAEE
jgi:GNAT superfamily N-acetyltransferase